MSTYVIVALVSYLLGSIPFGYVLVRLFLKTDVRTLGSGNIGATNVGRTGHRGLAIATLLLDAGKGAVAVIVARVLFDSTVFVSGASYDLPGALAREKLLAASLAALFAVLGHLFPVWLKFRGGKGVAAAVGAFALLAPKAVLVALAVFLVTVALSRFVSLGSILAAVAFPVAVFGLSTLQTPTYVSPGFISVIAVTSALVILKHHANIRRLLAGTENKLGAKAPLPENPIQTEKNA